MGRSGCAPAEPYPAHGTPTLPPLARCQAPLPENSCFANYTSVLFCFIRDTHVRGLLGHVRIDDPECVGPLNQAMALWSLWKNLYAPVMRLTSKTREAGRCKKRYDKARTPARRVLECALVSEERKESIRRLLAETDCFAMKRQVDRMLADVFAAIRARTNRTDPACPPPETSALRAAPAGPVSSGGQAGMKPAAGARIAPGSTRKTNKRLVS